METKEWKIAMPPTRQLSENEKVPELVPVINYLNDRYDFRRNDVLMRVEFKWKSVSSWLELEDSVLDTLIIQMKVGGLSVSKNTLLSLLNSAFIKKFNPIKHYFATLPAWDNKDHITQLADTITADDQEVWQNYFKKWLVGMVRSATSYDVTNQQMLVFKGEQGLGKTRWILKLLPKELNQYFFTGYTNLEDQVFAMKLARYVLIFLDELDSYKGAKLAIIKSTITQERIRIRPLFSNFDVEVKRVASFIAAINHESFLNDLSGSRRFLVVECLDIDHNHDINLEKVYSQAFHLARDNSFKHYFDKEEVRLIESRNDKFKVKSDAELMIEKYYEPCEENAIQRRILNATEIIKDLNDKSGIKIHCNPNTVGAILKNLDFKRVSRNGGKEKRWGYALKDRDL